MDPSRVSETEQYTDDDEGPVPKMHRRIVLRDDINDHESAGMEYQECDSSTGRKTGARRRTRARKQAATDSHSDDSSVATSENDAAGGYQRRSDNGHNAVNDLSCNNDRDENKLLSAGSSHKKQPMSEDFDSDETDFEYPVSDFEDSSSILDSPRRPKMKNVVSSSSEIGDQANDGVQKGSNYKNKTVNDWILHGGRTPSGGGNDAYEDVEMLTVGLSSGMEPMNEDVDSDETDFEYPKSDSEDLSTLRMSEKPKMKNDMSDSELSEDENFTTQQMDKASNLDVDQDVHTTPVYNPVDVLKEKWHGDVQRTVTMFNETIQQMPMPSDDGNENIKLPPGLVELYQHQKYGLRWLNWREGQFPGGGILADEMGLGKTVQIIALIMKSKWDAARSGMEMRRWRVGECFPSRATLIICPRAVIRQWRQEIETKGKDLSVHVYHGSKKLSSANNLAGYDVVITTYETISSEIPKQTEPPKPCFSPLKRVSWLRIVLDEAHKIRNPETGCALAICQLEALHRWAVTGTPIHNKPEDFYSMCNFLKLTPFDDADIWSIWIGLKHVRGTGAEQRLHILGKALILRRTKEEINRCRDLKLKTIPPKTVDMVSVELSYEERQVYSMLQGYAKKVLEEFLTQKEQRKLERGVVKQTCTPIEDRVQERLDSCREPVITFSHIFVLLLRLRQCAVLPHLIETMLEENEVEADEVLADEVKLEDLKPEHLFSTKNPVFDPLFVSSKFRKILDDVDEIRDKAKTTGEPMDKIIIVSSWTSSLDQIFEHLKNKNYCCVFITGRDNMETRSQNIDSFNKNRWRPHILLLSLHAGGVGLNLVGANHVFFVEPHWNPQHELQAQDRVHRFGQTKNVFIRRYIAEDTIEGKIMAMQQEKLLLADGLLSNTKKKGGAGITLEEIKQLFDIYNHRHDDNCVDCKN